MMTCFAADQLQRLVAGSLSDKEIDEAARHLEECAHCIDSLDELLMHDDLAAAVRTRTAIPEEPEATQVHRLLEVVRALPTSLCESNRPCDRFDFLSPPEQPDEIGRLGGYRVLRVLGRGGMGVVFRAEDSRLKRHVALKVMKPELAERTSARRRFLREAQVAAALKHDHIVTIYQVGEDRGVVFLAMEFLQGESLEDRLQRGRPPVSDLLRFGREMAQGLAAAHRQGLIHRDIKPANIWLESDPSDATPASPRIKILDFGLARATADDAQLTHHGALVGTPAYMAPEQACGGRLDPRSDLFSLGCVLYRLATRELPHKGETTSAVLSSLAHENPRPVSDFNPTLPPALATLITRLLAKDPADRPKSAAEVVEHLRAIEASLAVGSQPLANAKASDATAELPQPLHATAASHLTRRMWPRVTLGLVATLLGAVLLNVAILANRSRPDGSAKKLVRNSANDTEPTKITKVQNSGEELTFHERSWLQSVRAKGPEDQLQAVIDEMKRRNPGFDGKVVRAPAFPPDQSFICDGTFVRDISPLRALSQLKNLVFDVKLGKKSPLTDLRPLRGLPLKSVRLSHSSIDDLTPLESCPLRSLLIRDTNVVDLSPLRGMSFEHLDAGRTLVDSLAPLRGTQIGWLLLDGTRISDLGPLQEMSVLSNLSVRDSMVRDLTPLAGRRLTYLDLSGTKVEDLAALKGMHTLKFLLLKGVPATDLSPLQGMALQSIELDLKPYKSIPTVHGMGTLKTINNLAPDSFWHDYNVALKIR